DRPCPACWCVLCAVRPRRCRFPAGHPDLWPIVPPWAARRHPASSPEKPRAWWDPAVSLSALIVKGEKEKGHRNETSLAIIRRPHPLSAANENPSPGRGSAKIAPRTTFD